MICIGSGDPAKSILLYPKSKEEVGTILEDKQIGNSYDVLTLSFSNDDVSRDYEASFRITDSEYKYGLLKGIRTLEQTYEILILMNHDDVKSLQYAQEIMESIIIIP